MLDDIPTHTFTINRRQNIILRKIAIGNMTVRNHKSFLIRIHTVELTSASEEILSILQGDVGQFVCPCTDFCKTERTELERRRTETGEATCCAGKCWECSLV